MTITPSLKNEIERDISRCENHTERNGSEQLYSELVAKYTLIDKNFKNNLSTSGKATILGKEFDYRPELKAIAARLKMLLLSWEDVLNDSNTQHQKNDNIRRMDLKKLIERGNIFQSQSETGRSISSDYEKWVQDVHTFTMRYLKTHPAYSSLKDSLFLKKTGTILGCLRSVYDDSTFWNNNYGTSGQGEKMMATYDVFISHANNDKTEYVDELKESLDKLKISVFYDTDSLEWGDDWKRRILEGVQQAEFAIIVISNNFFDREWTEKELTEFLNRQNRNGQKVILPILHKITVQQLRDKYPSVADIQALDSSKYSCDEIALQFAAQLIKRLKS